MASGTRELLVRILTDTSKMVDGMNKAEGALGKLKSSVVKVGSAFAAGFVADQAVDFLVDATKAAEEDAAAQRILANQLKETTGATDAQIKSAEKFIGKLARQTGVMDDDLRPAFAALVRGTKDTDKAQRELAIAMDIAAARGVSLETVTSAMEKAHNGNIGALGRLGVATKDAEGNTLSLEEAMAGAAQTYQGAAEAAVTPSQRWNVAFQELKETVGTALLPVMNNLATFMAEKLLPAIEDAVIWVQENWPQIQKTIGDVFEKIKPWIDEFVHTIQIAWEVISGVFKTFNALLHGDFSKAWEAFKDMLSGVWEGIKNLVGDNIDKVKALFGDLLTEVGKLPGKLATAAAGLWDWIWDGFKAAWAKLANFWNGLEITLPKFHVWGTDIDIGGNTIGFPDLPVPRLAKGGIVSSPTLALIGESGPEAVVPLGRGMGGGSTVIHIANFYSSASTDSELVRQLNRIGRRSGGVPVSGGVRTVA